MTIRLLHGDQSFDLEMASFHEVVDIKQAVTEHEKDDQNISQYFVSLIYKNFIFLEESDIRNYRISPGDEIWMGQIEHYLTSDDLLLEMFLATPIRELMFLIVKIDDSLVQIRSAMKRVLPGYSHIDIWDMQGQCLTDGQLAREINVGQQYHKIILGGDKSHTFEECCKIHDRYLMDTFWKIHDWKYWKWLDSNPGYKWLDTFQYLDQFTSSIHKKTETSFSGIISDMPRAFQMSRYLFSTNIPFRIMKLCENEWISMADSYNGHNDEIPYYIFDGIFYTGIWHSILVYLELIEQTKETQTKSIVDIIDDAMAYLTDGQFDLRSEMKLCWSRFFIGSVDGDDIRQVIDEWNQVSHSVIVKLKRSIFDVSTLPSDLYVIKEAKKELSKQLGIPKLTLYYITSGGNVQLKDEDPLDMNRLNDTTDYNGDYFEILITRMDNLVRIDTLGKGAFGSADLYEDKISNKRLVIKIPLRKDYLNREINMYARLRDAVHINNYIGLYVVDNKVCLAMPYITGDTLRQYLSKVEPLAEDQIAKICSQLLQQIVEMHDRRAIHHDIKPDNIIVDKECRCVKLIDFGLSKCMEGPAIEYNTKYEHGTAHYRALELLNKEKYDEKIDVWSLGVVVIEMVNGMFQYTGQQALTAAVKVHRDQKFPFIPSRPISEDLDHFIKCCHESDPAERPSARQLLQSPFIKKCWN